MDSTDTYLSLCNDQIRAGKITATLYRRGAVIEGWPSRWPSSSGRPKSRRGIIQSQTRRSLIRASWQISNSPSNFDLMTTLTFHVEHPDPKRVLRQWMRDVPGCSGVSAEYCWVQEYQARGVVHYHVLHTLAALREYFGDSALVWREVWRRGKPVLVLSGAVGGYISGCWIAGVGSDHPDFVAFQSGGITERLTNPEMAGYYMGRYAGKEAQKQLPDGMAPAGRWWFLSGASAPVPRGTIPVTAWNYDRPHRLIYDSRRITQL